MEGIGLKQLKDYTLGDLQTVCQNNNQNCGKCMFRSIGCKRTYPQYYDLSAKIIFTEDELNTALVLSRCLPESVYLKKSKDVGKLYLVFGDSYIPIDNENVFPSLNEAESIIVTLKEIIENGVVDL